MQEVLDKTLELEVCDSQERDYILAVQAGYKESFRDLVNLYQSRVYALIYRQVQNVELSEDLTQDTFIRAYKGINSFKFESKFLTWLFKIAINVTRSYYSSRGYLEARNTELLEPNNEVFNQNSQLDTIDRETIKRISILASQLSEKLREVFAMCALEQMSYQEVSEILEIPVGTVRSRLNKARTEIKEKFYLEDGEL